MISETATRISRSRNELAPSTDLDSVVPANIVSLCGGHALKAYEFLNGFIYICHDKKKLSIYILFLLVFIAGCVNGQQPADSALVKSVLPSQAFVIPPPGGPAIVEVLERRYPNATEQKIYLRNEAGVQGEDFLDVQFFGPVGNTGRGRDALDNLPLSIAKIGKEISDEFPDTQMIRSPLFVQNRYGPFGYAVGRTRSGIGCIYAWQRISGSSSLPILFRSKGTIQLRLRRCGAGNSENSPLSTMYGLTIKAFFSDINWDPYGSSPGADPRLGSTGSPIYSTGQGGFERVIDADPVSDPTPSFPAPKSATRSKPRQAIARRDTGTVARLEPVILPEPLGSPVPPPPSTPEVITGPHGVFPQSPGIKSNSTSTGEAISGPAVPPPPANVQN